MNAIHMTKFVYTRDFFFVVFFKGTDRDTIPFNRMVNIFKLQIHTHYSQGTFQQT